MNQGNEGAFKQTSSLGSCTRRLLKDELACAPSPDSARRFSCVFLSTSVKDADRLNHHLSAAGIRAYHALDIRESELLLAITRAKILLIDIDHTFELWQETLQRLEESHPNVPKVVLTERNENIWSPLRPRSALDVIPKPAHLGDLLEALECAHSAEQEINYPQHAHARVMRVMAAVLSGSQPQDSNHLRQKIRRATVPIPHSRRCSIRVRVSAMMGKVSYVWWKSLCHRSRKQHPDA
jgi:hypothetical protein